MSGKKQNNKPAEKARFRSTFYHEGKRYECTGKSQKEADQRAAIRKDKLKRGETGVSSNMPVAQWAEIWLDTYKKHSVGEAQYKNYLGIINNAINPEIGGLALKSIKEVHLQKILNDRAGLSKSYISKLRITLNAIFLKAKQSKLIASNPAEYLVQPAAADGTHRSITDSERDAIEKLARTHYAGLWISMMLYAGLRPGETRALDWRHIDLKKRIIHVEQAMKATTSEIGEPKSAAGIRDVPISDDLYPVLLPARGEPFESVFKQPTTGKRHTKSSMTCLWKNFLRELDISMGAKVYRNKIVLSVVAEDLVPYCLRHTYCTDLQDAGVPINVARYLMGHTDISMTSRIYTHTTEKAIQDAADKINSYKRNSDGGKNGGKNTAN